MNNYRNNQNNQSNQTDSKGSLGGTSGNAAVGRTKPFNPLAKKFGHHVHKKTKQESKSDLKKSIRDTERSLKRNLSATQEQELQRRAKALRLKLQAKEQEEADTVFHEKYKYIRFVETKKIHRKIAQAKKQISTPSNSEIEGTDALAALQMYELYLLYVTHFPCDVKYISLFPAEPLSKDSKTALLQEKILQIVKQAHVDGLFERPGYVIRMKSIEASGVDRDSPNQNDDESSGEQESNTNLGTDMTVKAHDGLELAHTTQGRISKKGVSGKMSSNNNRDVETSKPKTKQEKRYHKETKQTKKEEETDDFFMD
ncbi:hypothetical protein BASA50_011169 [Batrachochytrium salamandrivorans]|uniref:rRNA-processing protein EFG1 n=1 Tax=Batrachochytrium salamandrivorans TaxID=1357716 RepID=A0ABQ8EWM8_9FUNG|nr:hypothetical protein BASA62_009348 [Batrachochytrium salamandrivorans]KAH6587778.1 hypothetical protein BASA50_011169 [Batrachochytrium salamandrivorans]KAH6595030.1 hypothetical protein BASA61_003898 [Batrachochytrium salamandrivorans]KAH9252339.1 hypothetical protein BASA81_009710 [Batrachochytrium salamandrivorans]KAH9271988.1 hypothetical protein BASA83_005834 [Batrachochytrium salamandrivorans]